jgi:hypothetical protein
MEYLGTFCKVKMMMILLFLSSRVVNLRVVQSERFFCRLVNTRSSSIAETEDQ